MNSVFKNPFYRFIALSMICYLSWFVLYDLWLKGNGFLDYVLGKSTTILTVKALLFLGYDAAYKETNGLFFFYNEGAKLLQMVPACNGQVLYPLFIGFIIATPGYLKDKIWFTIAGCIAIYFFNLLRVVALCIIKVNIPEYLAFNHKYTFTVLVYACIFAMWLLWIKYLMPKVKSSKI